MGSVRLSLTIGFLLLYLIKRRRMMGHRPITDSSWILLIFACCRCVYRSCQSFSDNWLFIAVSDQEEKDDETHTNNRQELDTLDLWLL